MDQKWKKLPLFVILLIFLGSAYGFKGGDYSNAHHWWGQPPDNTFSPHAVQSSVSEVPVTGILSEEVGSRIFTKRPLKRLNLLQFVKGHVSSSHESTSHAQSAPSSSNFASLPLPLSEWHAGSLALVQGSSGSSITDNASVPTQGESTSFPAVLVASGLSTSGHRSPSLYVSSSQETSAPVATYSSQGIPVPLSEGSGQSTSPQGEGSYSGLSPSQGPSSPFTPDSYIVSSSSHVSHQSTNEQSTPSLYSSSSQGSSGSLIEASGSSFQGEAAGLGSLVDLSLQSQETSRQLLPSPLVVSNQSINHQPLFVVSESSSDPQSTGPASALDTPGILSHSILSTQTQGSASTSLGSSGQLIPTQVESGRYSGTSQFLSTSSQYAPGSLLYRKFSALPVRDSSQSKNSQSSPSVSTSTQSGSGTLTSSHVSPVQAGSSFTSSSSQPQGTLGLYAPASPTKYVSVPVSSHPSVYSQSTSSSGAQFGPSTSFASQGMSSTYSGSVQPQGTKSQFPPGSVSSYPSVSLASSQGAVNPSAKVQSSRKLFTSSYGTQEGSSTPINLQGSSAYGGSLQPQGTTSHFAPGSSSSYPSVSLASPQGAASPSAKVQSSRKLFTSPLTGSSVTQAGSSTPINFQGSTTYGGSLQPQGTTSQFAPGSPSSYPSVSLSSPQGAAGPSATVQSSRKLFTSPLTGSSVTQAGSSTPINFQGSTTYGGSLQPQGTTSQFAPGSSSSYPSVSLASPQGAVSPSAKVQSSRKLFTSPFTGSSVTQAGSSTPINFQGSTTYGGSLQPQGTTSRFAPGSPSSYPSVSLSSPQGAAGPSATVQSSRKLFTSSYGTQEGSSTPINLQGSTAYGGSLQPQGTTSHFAPGSSSSYPSVSLASPQGAAGPSATVQSSRKLFTSPLTGSSVTQAGSSTPINFQGSTTYGGSLQPQGTTSQFAPGSPSSYPSVSLSSPQGAAGPSATVQSSRKLFTSPLTGSSVTQAGSSTPINFQGSTTYGGSLQPQGTTSQFAPGSSSSYPSVSLASPQGAVSPSATVQSSRKLFTSPFTGSSVTQAGSSTPINFQGSTTYGGSLQPQGTTSRFAPGSPSSYPSVSLSSPQGAAGPSATVQSSRKLFTSSYGTQEGSSTPINLQGSTAYGGSLQPQGTTSHFAPGSSSSYPSVSLASPQGAAGPSATVQSSRKLFTSPLTGSSVTQAGSSTPINFQGSATYGGSLQPQGTTSQFAPGSSSSYPSVSLASPQGAVSPSATVQSSWKLFTSSYGTQEGSSTPINLQGSTAYGGSLQPQGTTSQFALAAPSSCKCDCESLSSPQGVASQLSQALQSYSVSQRQKSSGWQPSQGFATSGATESQGSSPSQSLPMQIRFSSLPSAGGSSRDFGQFVSAQGGSTSYGGSSLYSQSPSSKDTPGSHAYAKLGSSPVAVSTQSFSDRRSNGLYSSDTLRTQGLISVVERPSRLSYQVPSDSPSSDQISKHLTSQRPTVSNLVPSPGLSAQAPSVGMFSGVQQTTQARHESGSAVQPNQQFLMPLLQGLKDSRKLPQNTK